MYKGIVLKVTTEYTVVITDDKDFYKIISKEGLKPGQRIYFFEEDKLSTTSKYDRKVWFNDLQKRAIALSVMAACIAFFFLFNGVFGLESKGSYFAVVSVDINPSVELRLNEGSYVIGIEALNQDGKKVAGKNLLGLKVDKAISQIIENAEKMNYLNPENDTVLLATALNTVEIEPIQKLMEELANIQLPKEYSYLIIPMERDKVAKAKEKDLSLGKYALLDLAGGEFQAEEVRKMKVKDLITSKTIQTKLQEKEEKKQLKEDSKKAEKQDNYKDKDKDINKATDKNQGQNQEDKIPSNNTLQKNIVQIPSEKITDQGPYLKDKQGIGNQDKTRQFITEKEQPGEARKGTPYKEPSKVKLWPQNKMFFFP